MTPYRQLYILCFPFYECGIKQLLVQNKQEVESLVFLSFPLVTKRGGPFLVTCWPGRAGRAGLLPVGHGGFGPGMVRAQDCVWEGVPLSCLPKETQTGDIGRPQILVVLSEAAGLPACAGAADEGRDLCKSYWGLTVWEELKPHSGAAIVLAVSGELSNRTEASVGPITGSVQGLGSEGSTRGLEGMEKRSATLWSPNTATGVDKIGCMVLSTLSHPTQVGNGDRDMPR